MAVTLTPPYRGPAATSGDRRSLAPAVDGLQDPEEREQRDQRDLDDQDPVVAERVAPVGPPENPDDDGHDGHRDPDAPVGPHPPPARRPGRARLHPRLFALRPGVGKDDDHD